MRVMAVGDSFTYGDELSDINQAWPYLLSKKIKYEITNFGKPSAGNTSMVRTVVDEIKNYDLFIIAWSHFARIEFADEHGVYDTWPGASNLAVTDDIAYRKELTTYLTRHHNDTYLYNQYLINIILLQQFLKCNNKKYIMLDSFGNNIKRINTAEWNSLSQINTTNYIGWPSSTMMEWTYQLPKGPKGHFLEEGHAIVADKIYEHIRNLGWVS